MCGMEPEVAIEIGTLRGGTAAIMTAALKTVGHGRLFAIDTNPQFAPEISDLLEPEATIVVGRSPDILGAIRARAGAPFDFVFVDGHHTFSGVRADLFGIRPHLRPGAHVALHDANNQEIARAISAGIAAGLYLDCGMVCRQAHRGEAPVLWAGVQLLRCPT